MLIAEPMGMSLTADSGLRGKLRRRSTRKRENRAMIDRIDTHPTPVKEKIIEKRNGEERRKIFTMLDPDIDRRKGERRKRSRKNRYLS